MHLSYASFKRKLKWGAKGKSQHTLNQLYSIPPALPEELVNWLGTNLALNEE